MDGNYKKKSGGCLNHRVTFLWNWGRLAAGGLFLAVPGCTTFPMPDGAKSTPAFRAEKLRPQEQETLSAVEEFLSRTQQYSLKNEAGTMPPPQEARSPGANLPEAMSGLNEKLSSIPTAGSATETRESEPPPTPAVNRVVANSQVAIAPPAASKAQPAIPALQSVSVRATTPAKGTIGGASPADVNVVNAPLDTRTQEEAAWEKLLKELKRQVEQKKDVDSEWRLRLAQLAIDQTAEARQVSKSLPQDSQDLLAAFVGTGTAIREVARNPMSDAQDALAQVAQLESALTRRSDPVVRSIALCRKVLTFGTYEVMGGEEFVAGRAVQTIVYCEVDHLHFEPMPEGLHRAKLSTRLEILTADGKSVWQREEPEIIDTCRQKRRDFFIAQKVTLPATLAPGDYVLKVSVADKIANRSGEATHAFSIVSPMSVAKTTP